MIFVKSLLWVKLLVYIKKLENPGAANHDEFMYSIHSMYIVNLCKLKMPMHFSYNTVMS